MKIIFYSKAKAVNNGGKSIFTITKLGMLSISILGIIQLISKLQITS